MDGVRLTRLTELRRVTLMYEYIYLRNRYAKDGLCISKRFSTTGLIYKVEYVDGMLSLN